MTKSAEAFRTISEVSELLDTPTHVLRFWETKFSQIKPVKRAGGRRYYRPNDVALIAGIKHMLQVDGLAIKEAQATLRKRGVKAVTAHGHELVDGAAAPEETVTETAADNTAAIETVAEAVAAPLQEGAEEAPFEGLETLENSPEENTAPAQETASVAPETPEDQELDQLQAAPESLALDDGAETTAEAAAFDAAADTIPEAATEPDIAVLDAPAPFEAPAEAFAPAQAPDADDTLEAPVENLFVEAEESPFAPQDVTPEAEESLAAEHEDEAPSLPEEDVEDAASEVSEIEDSAPFDAQTPPVTTDEAEVLPPQDASEPEADAPELSPEEAQAIAEAQAALEMARAEAAAVRAELKRLRAEAEAIRAAARAAQDAPAAEMPPPLLDPTLALGRTEDPEAEAEALETTGEPIEAETEDPPEMVAPAPKPDAFGFEAVLSEIVAEAVAEALLEASLEQPLAVPETQAEDTEPPEEDTPIAPILDEVDSEDLAAEPLEDSHLEAPEEQEIAFNAPDGEASPVLADMDLDPEPAEDALTEEEAASPEPQDTAFDLVFGRMPALEAEAEEVAEEAAPEEDEAAQDALTDAETTVETEVEIAATQELLTEAEEAAAFTEEAPAEAEPLADAAFATAPPLEDIAPREASTAPDEGLASEAGTAPFDAPALDTLPERTEVEVAEEDAAPEAKPVAEEEEAPTEDAACAAEVPVEPLAPVSEETAPEEEEAPPPLVFSRAARTPVPEPAPEPEPVPDFVFRRPRPAEPLPELTAALETTEPAEGVEEAATADDAAQEDAPVSEPIAELDAFEDPEALGAEDEIAELAALDAQEEALTAPEPEVSAEELSAPEPDAAPFIDAAPEPVADLPPEPEAEAEAEAEAEDPEPALDDSAYSFVAPRGPRHHPVEAPEPEQVQAAPKATQEWHQPSLFDYFPPEPPEPELLIEEELEPEPDQSFIAEDPAPEPEPEPEDALEADARDFAVLPEPDPEPEDAPLEAQPEPLEDMGAEPQPDAFDDAPSPLPPVEPFAAIIEALTPAQEPPEPAEVLPPPPDPLERVVSLILSGTAPLNQAIPTAGQIDPSVNPLGALKEGLGQFAPTMLSPIERMRLLSSHDRLMALQARLAQPPRPPPARR
ncbi:MerR-like DNA binding protein [Rhodobacter aestuarii]|uniref:MerR HTH family regulatory protein n=1 Tax=Rhodobacter aestuarii TaxID=453582 RepID=A0A1N7J6U6_9RHOB|nr:MerR family transcriptional regulator [Rhodobacter aestuarii]PTV97121.1 MerR-like DNA binding protein [Rhodobacter aestuarii]SIS45034.1 MerR HTH family regulatory protein [Rhodobacter aestuarii]